MYYLSVLRGLYDEKLLCLITSSPRTTSVYPMRNLKIMSTFTLSAANFSILYFASAASFTNKSSDLLPAPMKLSDLFDHLETIHPKIKQNILHSCALTVNLEYVDVEADADMLINHGDEVAVIPPVSSG
ncbi:hypothetical protein E4T42_08288 [Aureobasidium subglaciale]|nr:hypothetical protein E4T42_08288 [Aureobasidium subglaciale]